MSLKLLTNQKCFEGEQRTYVHDSEATSSKMKFGIFLPPLALSQPAAKLPVLYFLSGLGCTHENFIHKSGMQRYATKHNIIVVNPDTSPRHVPIGEQTLNGYIGPGASFYVDATQEPWHQYYQMYSYISREFPQLINTEFPVQADKWSIFGDSMGGHGALVCFLRNPAKFKSISVFEPVSNPTTRDMTKQVFAAYLGADNTQLWQQYDATCLLEKYQGPVAHILVDQGTCDDLYRQGELMPENLISAAKSNNNINITLKLRDGYSHGSMFVKTFIGEHFAYHAAILNGAQQKL